MDVNGPVEELILLSTAGKDNLEILQMVLAIFSADISWFGRRFWAKAFLERASGAEQMPFPLPSPQPSEDGVWPLSCSGKT